MRLQWVQDLPRSWQDHDQSRREGNNWPFTRNEFVIHSVVELINRPIYAPFRLCKNFSLFADIHVP